MKITKFEWKQRAVGMECAYITIKHGWWIFSYEEVEKVIRINKAYSNCFGQWWIMATGQDIDIPEHFYQDDH